jgi:hypothetical protein
MSQEGENNELSISNRNGNDDKLNINSKSSREMLHKEEIEEDKPTKDNVEKTIERENDEKNKMKDNKKEEKKNEELESLDNEVKLPIIPYKVSDAYPQQLITALRKNEHCRPRSLLAPDFFDITRNIDDLEKDEEKKLKLEEQEHNSLENKERSDQIHLNSFKESSFNGNTKLEDPFALFYKAETAYIDQYYKLSDLFVICPIYMSYRISLEYCIGEVDGRKEYGAYHLFNTKETSPPCTHNFCANQARDININLFNIVLEPEERKRKIQKFVTLKKGCRCAFSCFCACCTRPTFYVDTPIGNLGKIIEKRTICDPIIEVRNINDEVVYVISTSGSSCGFCCRDQCCDSRKCASCEFIIYDGTMQYKYGTIHKDHKSGKKMRPDYDQLKVVFPPDISCQDKILLLCASLALEYLYFQNFTNMKRCSGAPRFLNSYSD